MLSLHTPYDLQIELKDFIKKARKQKKFSTKSLARKSGVPDSTIRKFESTGEISLRQFLCLYAAVAQLKKIRCLTEIEETPKSIDEVIASQNKQ